MEWRTMKKLAILMLLGLTALTLGAAATLENSKQNSSQSSSIDLPAPSTDGGMSVEKALDERRSIRSFTHDPLTLEEVSQLLWAAQGVTNNAGHRTAPSAMARYPLEVYLMTSNVTGLPAGVYHYSPQVHKLTILESGNKIPELFGSSAGRRDWRENASAIFIITGVFERMNKVPGRDLSRFVYIEAGASAENLLLEVVSLNLGATYTAGFDANKVREILKLSEGEMPIGVLPVGKRA
jgi:SagB-type dehydrogenase family enzyme